MISSVQFRAGTYCMAAGLCPWRYWRSKLRTE